MQLLAIMFILQVYLINKINADGHVVGPIATALHMDATDDAFADERVVGLINLIPFMPSESWINNTVLPSDPDVWPTTIRRTTMRLAASEVLLPALM